MPSLTMDIKHDSDIAKSILAECRSKIRASQRDLSCQLKKWADAEDRARAFMTEREADRVRKNVREGGLPQYTTIQIPYDYAVLMSAHTYLTSVFMGRNPILQFSGRHGESQQQVQAVEALVDYQMLVGMMLVPIYIWLYDYLKYGIGINELYWEERIETFSEFIEYDELDPLLGTATGKVVKEEYVEEVIRYVGNRIQNVQPQDFLWDTRYPAHDFQKGEYCGVRFSENWNEVVRKTKAGFYMEEVVDKLKNAYTGDMFSGTSQLSSLEKPEVNDPTFFNFDRSDLMRKHPSLVKGYRVHMEIIPSELGIATRDYPEKWVFTCTGDFSYLMGASPLGARHCQFPFNVLHLEPEGYGLVTRGIPEILEPVQNTIDWLINSHFYNTRAALNNKFIVDPSRVVMKDVLDPAPGGIIRLKEAAYGTDPKLAMTQFPVQDVTQNHLRDLPMMYGIGERTMGVNDQLMGMLNTGGRKTATEVRTSTSFGVNRMKTIAEFGSASGFDTMSQQIVSNQQQFYDMEMQFRIVGDLIATAGSKFISVNPAMISGFYDFVPIDGTLPIDRYAQATLWQNIMGQLRQFPQLMMRYDIGRIFEWVAQLAGLKNITQFRIQMGSPEALMNQAAMGNMIPIGANSNTPKGMPPGATSPETGQLPGMGATG